MPKYRGVIWAKTIITEERAHDFHKAMSETFDSLEDAGQQYGWCMAVISDDDTVPQEIVSADLPIKYRPQARKEVDATVTGGANRL